MTAAFSTTYERVTANALARNFAEAAVKARREDMQDAIDDTVRGLWKLYIALGPTPYMDDTVNGLLDVISNTQGDLDRDLDSVGAWSPAALDASEAHELLAKIRGEK